MNPPPPPVVCISCFGDSPLVPSPVMSSISCESIPFFLDSVFSYWSQNINFPGALRAPARPFSKDSLRILLQNAKKSARFARWQGYFQRNCSKMCFEIFKNPSALRALAKLFSKDILQILLQMLTKSGALRGIPDQGKGRSGNKDPCCCCRQQLIINSLGHGVATV